MSTCLGLFCIVIYLFISVVEIAAALEFVACFFT